MPQSLAAGMRGKTNAVERFELGTRKLRRRGKAARFMGILPDEKHLVGGVERVDLEFEIRIAAGDKALRGPHGKSRVQ